MKLVVISDTHEREQYVTVPDGDVLIHCGDWTNQGGLGAIDKFMQWFVSHPHKNKVFIAGNHELSLANVNRENAMRIINNYLNNNVKFLENAYTIIEGVKFYGTPTTPYFYDWAFNYERGPAIAAEWAKIPNDTEVLITHGPPYGVLDLVQDTIQNLGRDLHQGCEDLAKRLGDLTKLKAHVFGHLHTNGGQSQVIAGVTFANAAICTENYKPTNLPIEIVI